MHLPAIVESKVDEPLEQANLRSSTDSLGEQARQDFANVQVNNQITIDACQLSFGEQVSIALDAFGIGGCVDSNVIYSQQAFMPRSIRTNCTGSFFGPSFDLLELYANLMQFDEIIVNYRPN